MKNCYGFYHPLYENSCKECLDIQDCINERPTGFARLKLHCLYDELPHSEDCIDIHLGNRYKFTKITRQTDPSIHAYKMFLKEILEKNNNLCKVILTIGCEINYSRKINEARRHNNLTPHIQTQLQQAWNISHFLEDDQLHNLTSELLYGIPDFVGETIQPPKITFFVEVKKPGSGTNDPLWHQEYFLARLFESGYPSMTVLVSKQNTKKLEPTKFSAEKMQDLRERIV